MSNRNDYPTAKELAEGLRGERQGGNWKAHCPAHEDGKSSLSISENEGRVLVHCHAGCTQDAVLEQLRGRGLWPGRKLNGKSNGKHHGKARIVETYDYVDEAGQVVSQAVRYEPKNFKQRRPDGRNGWIWDTEGVPPLPYRLPELLEAIAKGQIVFVVEGEKDVNNLAKIGIVATCNAAGAGKWRAEHAAYLKDADVVAIPDNDDAGREHAGSVVASIKAIAKRVRLLDLPNLPPKGDVSNWLTAGGTVEQLWALVERAPERQPTEVPPPRTKREAANEDEPHWNVEPSAEPISGSELLEDICSVLRRYMVLPEYGAETIALWILHAWTIGATYISPYLVFISPTKQCGKTTLMTIVYWMTPRSVLASNISAASIFRFIEDRKGCPPTLLIDEADSFTKENEALRNILNSGHTRSGAYVIRCEGEGKNIRTRKFSTWAAKVIATIRSLADTLMDRSIAISLRRKTKSEKVARFALRDTDEFARLRRMCLRWAEDNMRALEAADPSVPTELDNRPADNWRPLLAIADLAGGDWSTIASKAARALSGLSEDQDSGVELLRDIRRVFSETNADWLGAKVLCQHLIALEEAPWAEYRNDKAISPRAVAKLLKGYRIKSKHERAANTYHKGDFQEAWDSYLPQEGDLSSTSSTT